jgi:hypothetical protein
VTITTPPPTTTEELNAPLLFQLIQWAERDERDGEFQGWGHWDQSAWGWVPTDPKEVRNGACQSAYCMAGQAAHQAGWRLLYDGGDEIIRSVLSDDSKVWQGSAISASECVPQRNTGVKDSKGFDIWEDIPGGEAQPISVVGREALGLESDEAEMFFDGDNTLDTLKEMANLFCQDRGLPLLYPNEPIYVAPDPDDDSDW